MNLLVVFDAAARHLSFKEAAKELFVTPSAVGHQIRVLEKEVGTPLFRRLNRSIVLTQQGKAYHQEISASLRSIANATRQLIDAANQQSLHIHCIPYITNALIVPNLQSFKAKYPDLRIGIESKVERAKIQSVPIQVAIRHDKTNDPELVYEALTDIYIAPVCSPNYAHMTRPVPNCAQGAEHGSPLNLIQLSTDPDSWQQWGADWHSTLNTSETIYCDGFQSVVDMARQGLGLAMGYFPILNPLLANKQLMLPFPDQISAFGTLYLAYARQDKDNPIVTAFSAWLKHLIAELDSDKNFSPDSR